MSFCVLALLVSVHVNDGALRLLSVCVCVCACMRACVRACVRACMCACVAPLAIIIHSLSLFLPCKQTQYASTVDYLKIELINISTVFHSITQYSTVFHHMYLPYIHIIFSVSAHTHCTQASM